MEYNALAVQYQLLEQESSRLAKTTSLASFLKEITTDELEAVILLLQGVLYPRQENKDTGIATKLVVRALSVFAARSPQGIIKQWKETGDLGKVAEAVCKDKQQQVLIKSEPLTIKKVFTTLRKITETTGTGSITQKLQLVVGLLTSARPLEAKYLTRTLLQDLRIGVGEGVLRDAIVSAYLSTLPEKPTAEERATHNQFVNATQLAYDITNNFALVAATVKEKGKEGLQELHMQLGTPINVMLAIKAESLKEELKEKIALEYKFDGFRVQIHKGDDIKIFTRRLEDITKQFPDIVESVQQHVKGTCILDAEAVGFDSTTKRYLPFQSISQRIKRKHNIELLAKKFPVEVNVFDIVLHEDVSLLDKSFHERRALLEKVIAHKERVIKPANQIITNDVQEAQAFFEKSKTKGNEGVMIKKLNAPYKPGARVGYMLKYKETLETLDLVIIGAEWGKGKRSEWLSTFEVACVDGPQFLGIGKVATGLKEKPEEGASFQELTALLQPLILKEEDKHITVKPFVILEVAYEEIQKSSTYTSSYALRFPRVIRIRYDKGIADISPLSFVKEVFEQQRF